MWKIFFSEVKKLNVIYLFVFIVLLLNAFLVFLSCTFKIVFDG